MKKTSFYAVLSVAALVLATCATRAPTRPAIMKGLPAPPTPATQPSAPADPDAAPEPREPFMNQVVTLTFTLPEGWEVVITRTKYLTRVYFLGDNRGALVVITPYPTTDGTPKEIVEFLMSGRDRRDKARQVTADDGKMSRCFWSDRANGKSGAYAARIMNEDGRVSAVIMGSWPTKRDAAVRKQFLDIANSVKYE